MALGEPAAGLTGPVRDDPGAIAVQDAADHPCVGALEQLAELDQLTASRGPGVGNDEDAVDDGKQRDRVGELQQRGRVDDGDVDLALVVADLASEGQRVQQPAGGTLLLDARSSR